MSKVVSDISISADGYGAGPNQTRDKPFGDGPVERLHAWMFDTPDENAADVNEIVNAGAFVMGRNMLGRSAATGIWTGKAGGATSLRITHRCSCSPTIPASR